MKKIIFSLALLLFTGCVLAQTENIKFTARKNPGNINQLQVFAKNMTGSIITGILGSSNLTICIAFPSMYTAGCAISSPINGQSFDGIVNKSVIGADSVYAWNGAGSTATITFDAGVEVNIANIDFNIIFPNTATIKLFNAANGGPNGFEYNYIAPNGFEHCSYANPFYSNIADDPLLVNANGSNNAFTEGNSYLGIVTSAPPAPVLSVIDNCDGTSSITAKDGSNANIPAGELTWSNAGSGNPIIVSSTTPVTATRTINAVVSISSNAVTPAPKNAPAAPILLVIDNCNGTSTITSEDGLNASIPVGELTWSNGGSGNPIIVSSTIPVTATRTVSGCQSVSSNTVTPAPKATPEAPDVSVIQPTCAIPTGTIKVTSPLGAGIQYNLDGGPYQSDVNFFGIAANSTHTIIAQSALGCFSPGSALVTVGPQPFVPTPPTISGPVNVCTYIGTATPVTYHATTTGATSFIWVLPPNVNIVSGATTADITVTFAAAFLTQANKQFRVSATSACGSSTLSSIFYVVAQVPNTPQPIVPSITSVCASIGTNVTITYTIPSVLAAASYLWTIPGGTTDTHPNGINNPNDTVIVLTFLSTYSTGSLTVAAVNTCNTSGVRSLTITRNNPSIPGLISGPTNPCSFISPSPAAVYTVTPMSGVQYLWTASNGATLQSGQGTNSIAVSYPVGYTGGKITVQATNGCGISGLRNLNIAALSPATPSVIDVVQIGFCPNRLYTYSLSAIPANATSVLWTVPTVATIMSGQGTASIVVSFPATSVNGVVTVTAVNGCANSSIRSTSVKLPTCPPAERGRVVEYEKPAKIVKPAETVSGLKVEIYPNPTIHDSKLRVITGGKEEINVRVFDAQGRLFKQLTVMPYQAINLGEELKAGAYIVVVMQGTTVRSTKLFKF